jgi:hypothetical protein
MEKPKIRFKSFEKRWESYRLSEYSNYRRGSFPQPYGNKEWYGGDNAMPFVQVVDVLENLRLVADTKQKISTLAQPMSVFVPSDSVIVTLQGSIGRVAITQYDAYVDRTILIFEDYNSQTNKEFWAYTIRNKFEIERQKAPGGTIKTITKEALSDFKVSIPEYTEQSAIGSLFRILDDLLASYKDNLASYQSLKATMLSKMFLRAGQTVPEIRLDGFEGEWEELQLSDICQKVTEKNKDNKFNETFTNSAEFGIINQRDFFEKDISNEKSLNTYYVVRNNDFVYNPRISNYAPVGPIKRNKLGRTGVMSPLYFVFRIIDSNIDLNFLETFFDTNTWHKFMKLNGDSGARADRFAIKDSVFLTMPIAFPSLPEQQAIGAYFSNLDNLINSYQEKISQLETLKKKLLQDMFI